MEVNVQPGDALVAVDVQKDFLPGGALGVPKGDEVVPVLNRYIEIFQREGRPIFATRDWHPKGHCSFVGEGGIWPEHCVAETAGAAFAEELKLPGQARIISKGREVGREAYSGFEGTELEEDLRKLGVRRLFIGGLATDYCVLGTVLGALNRGFEVYLLEDAIRAVNAKPEDGKRAEEEMRGRGAKAVRVECLK